MKKLIIIFIILITGLGTSQAKTGERELGRRYLKLGNTYREAGNTELSEKYLLKGYSIVKKHSDFYWIAVAEEYLGYYYIDTKEYDKALKMLKSAKSLYNVYGKLKNGEGSNKAITKIIETLISKTSVGKKISESDAMEQDYERNKELLPDKSTDKPAKQKNTKSKFKTGRISNKEIINGGNENEAPVSEVRKTGYSLKEIEEETFELINNFRRSQGLKSLVWDENIASECRQHSGDMLSGDSPFGHDGFEDRAEKINKNLSTKYTGENVVKTYEQLGPAESAFQAWINSPGHYRNIIDPDYSISAIGAVRSPQGKYYMTQIFSGNK